MITTATVRPNVRFAVFYVCWLEYAVCSEIEDENSTVQCRLSQCETEHYRTLQAVTMWHRTLQNTAGCHSVKQNTTEHCRLSQC